MVFGRGHSVGTATGLLLQTILCKSLILMLKVKFVKQYTEHVCMYPFRLKFALKVTTLRKTPTSIDFRL